MVSGPGDRYVLGVLWERAKSAGYTQMQPQKKEM